MHISQSVEPVLNIRTCGASVGDFVTGFSVPINALYTMDDAIGVVVADGGVQTFVGVTVISYPGCGYSVCSSDIGGFAAD